MSKITKKQLHNGWHCHDTEIIKMKKELRELKQSVLRLEKLTDEKLLDEPQLKQLDQSVFKEWADCWKFFATDEDGDAWRYREKPKIDNGDNRWSSSNTVPLLIGTGYDTTDWQNSLIERDTAKELIGSDLARAMLARGDKYVMCGVSDVDDADAASNEYDDLVSDAVTDFNCKDGLFGTVSMRWSHAVPINNQGEPLTAAEAGF